MSAEDGAGRPDSRGAGTVTEAQLDALLNGLLKVMKGDLEVRLPVSDPDSVLHAINLAINTTVEELAEQQRALTESERRFRTVANAAADAIIVMDHRAQITLWNPAAERMFGWSSQEILGRPLHETITPQRFRPLFAKGYEAFGRTGQGPAIGRTLELAGLRKGGEEFPVELSLAALRVDDAWHAIGNLRDISQRKETERQLASVKSQLEARVAELEAAAQHIEALQKILPICMFCKQIRYDDQSWQRIDRYLTQHADTKFSHSLCPDCAAEHCPDLMGADD